MAPPPAGTLRIVLDIIIMPDNVGEIKCAAGTARGHGDAAAAPTMLCAALAYAAAGAPVFPVIDKRPLTKHGFHDASCDPDVIRGWWKEWPAAGIAMPTGNIVVLDLDAKGDRNGFVAIPNWRELTPIVSQTPSGGRHLYFAGDGSVRCSSDAIAPGVDVRGSGGYIILPPTPGYSWVGLDILAPDATLPPLPERYLHKSKKERANGHDDDGGAASSLGAGSTGGERGSKAGDADEIAVAAACLRVISPNCSYGDWFEIAAALRFEFGPDAFGMFDAWSARAPMKYDPATCMKKWEEVANVGGFTIKTIVFQANQYDPNWREYIGEERARLEAENAKANEAKPDGANDNPLELFDPWQPFIVPRFPPMCCRRRCGSSP